MGSKARPGDNTNDSIFSSTLFGAGFFAAWFFAGLVAYSGFEVMGQTDKTLKSYVASNYFWYNIFFQSSIFLAMAGIGAGAGFLSGLFARRIGAGRIFAGVMTILFWLVMVVRLVVRQPQFFDGPFLDSKPLLKSLVFAPANWLDPFMADTMAAIVMAALAAIPVFVFITWLIKSRTRVALFATMVIGWGTLSSGAIAGGASHPAQKPNVVLLVIDSLRPDHLSINGYKRKTTPYIDSIAERGAIFENVIADLPRTFPSWVSMMTGHYSITHGVRHMFPTVEQRRLIHPPLPRIMAERGWSTAVVADFAGDIFPRVDLGFQIIDAPDFTFDDLVRIRNLEIHPISMAFLNNPVGQAVFPSIREMVNNCDPRQLMDRVETRLRGFDADKPFFLSVFFSATHIPYAAPGPYYNTYTDPKYDGAHLFQRKNMLMRSDDVTDADVRHFIDLYDGALRAVDEQIGRLLDTLKELGYDGNTIIAVTGDHGENFYEYHAEIGHGNHLRGPHAMTVPLAFYDPRREFKEKKIPWQVRLIDLAPTLADLSGVDMRDVTGESLTPMLEGEEKNHRLAYSETGLWYVNEGPFFYQKLRINYPGVTTLCEVDDEWRREVVIKNRYQPLVVAAKHRMVSDGRRKLVVMPTRDGMVTELYDLEKDLGETHDISSEDSQALADMAQKLKAILRENSDTVFYQNMAFFRRDFTW